MTIQTNVEVGKLELVKPSKEYELTYRQYIESLGNEVRYPFSLDFEHADFDAMLIKIDNLESDNPAINSRVPSSTFWLIDGNEMVGVTNLRHRLNESIRHIGGHVGVSIKPSKRGTGLSKVLLDMTLNKAHEKGIDELHIHCYQANIASAKMIESCGGVLTSQVLDGNNQLILRYIIKRQ